MHSNHHQWHRDPSSSGYPHSQSYLQPEAHFLLLLSIIHTLTLGPPIITFCHLSYHPSCSWSFLSSWFLSLRFCLLSSFFVSHFSMKLVLELLVSYLVSRTFLLISLLSPL